MDKERRWIFYNDGKRKLGLLLFLSLSPFVLRLGFGFGIWTDWAGPEIYLGPLTISVGLDRKRR